MSERPRDMIAVKRTPLCERGGNRDVNAEIVRRILHGDERGPKRDAVLLNAAAGLFVANRAKSLADGWTLAAQIIDGGAAAQKLRELTE